MPTPQPCRSVRRLSPRLLAERVVTLMKRIISAALAALMLVLSFSAMAGDVSAVRLRPGNYLRLGSYMGRPLIWRCVGRDGNGLLFISRDIICFKAYSAGLSRWDRSWLRKWLNSEDAAVDWEGQAPDGYTADGNAYADEPGFLSGFSPEERKLILTAEDRSALNEADAGSADEGGAVHLYNSTGQFAKTVQNYDEAYAVVTEDRVFCPNISQMELVMTNFPTDFVAAPTRAALDQTGNIKNLESLGSGYYWLRDSLGNAEFTESVRCVYPDGRVLFADSFDSSVGVRPAIYVKDEITAIGGNGYENSPYYVSDEILSLPLDKGSAADNAERLTLRGAYSSITEGDYLSAGRYNGEEILWRCVDINENGPLMLSDRILSFKSFDASGDHGDELRDGSGSNNWAMSNIRAWLNSEDAAVDWPCGNAPASDRCEGNNGYSKEKGFLTSFSPEERPIIARVPVRTVIYTGDIDDSTLGSEPMQSLRNVNNLGNYSSAYASVTYDRVFLLSIGEANLVKNDFGSFLTARPTANAVNLNEAGGEDLSADLSAVWWLRDADAEQGCNVRAVTLDGWIHSIAAVRSSNGIRPAFYLDMDNASFIGGDGSKDEPYRVEGHSFGDWYRAEEPSCTETGIRRRTCLTCGENEDEVIPVTGHSFGKGAVTDKSIFGSTTLYVCASCGEEYTVRSGGVWPLAAGALILALIGLWALLRKLKGRF